MSESNVKQPASTQAVSSKSTPERVVSHPPDASALPKQPYTEVEHRVGDVKARIEALIVANTDDRVSNEAFQKNLEDLRSEFDKIHAEFYPQTPLPK